MSRKVLFVESGLGYGGSAFSLARLVKSLDPARYEPHVVVSHGGEGFERVRSLGIPVRILPFFRPLFSRSPQDNTLRSKVRNFSSVYGNLGADTLYNGIRLASYIRRHRIDLVHLNNGLAENLSGAFAARLARVPCVAHLRGTEWLTKVDKRFATWVSAVITLNSSMFQHCVPVFGNDKVHLIFNGVDLDAFQDPRPEKIRQEFGIRPNTFLVGTFARLVEGKGIPEFVAAAARVNRLHRDSRFFIIGHEPMANKGFEVSMRKLAAELGLSDQLVFAGWRNDRIDMMAAMDVVLQISTTFPEGMSLAPLEAMALGRPVIVTSIPGYEFCVDGGRTGFVVAPGDVEALADKVLMLACDRDLGQRMGEEGYRKALREFDIRLTAARVREVYDQVLDHAEISDRGVSAAARAR